MGALSLLGGTGGSLGRAILRRSAAVPFPSDHLRVLGRPPDHEERSDGSSGAGGAGQIRGLRSTASCWGGVEPAVQDPSERASAPSFASQRRGDSQDSFVGREEDGTCNEVSTRHRHFGHKSRHFAAWAENELEKFPEAESSTTGTAESVIQSWNRKLARLIRVKKYEKVIEVFRQMQQQGLHPDKFTYLAVLKACAGLQALDEGMHLHAQIMKSEYEWDTYVSTALVDMYGKCGSIEDARRVFENMHTRSPASWTAMIVGCVKCRRGGEALEVFRRMQQEGVEANSVTFVGVLNACAKELALKEGRRIHAQVVQKGCEANPFVANTLMDMYLRCGRLKEAQKVFTRMPRRGVVAWSTMITGHARHGHTRRAVELFWQMRGEGVNPNAFTFVGVLNACSGAADIEEGRRVHYQINEQRLTNDAFVSYSLIEMYANCKSMMDARRVFDTMATPTMAARYVMVWGYVDCGQKSLAVKYFHQMQREESGRDVQSFLWLLKACAAVEALQEGRRIHEQIVQRGLESHSHVGNTLILMYAKCGSLTEALRVFNGMAARDVWTWTSMISGCVQAGEPDKALDLYHQMQEDGVDPDVVCYAAVVQACGGKLALEEGRQVHEQIVRNGSQSDISLSNGLIDMYAKCGTINDAWDVFDKMPVRNVCSWDTMIFGLVNSGQPEEALELFSRMQLEGIVPNHVTFVGIIRACANTQRLQEGRLAHEQIIEKGYESNDLVGGCLIDMYAKCGHMEDAWAVFKKLPKADVFVYSVMILGCVRNGLGLKALELYRQMEHRGVEQNSYTFVAGLNACADVAALEQGKRIHDQTVQKGYESDIFVSNSLVDMFAKCGSIDDAQKVFGKMPKRDSFSWNAMLRGYAIHGDASQALCHFEQMRQEGVEVNQVTAVALLSACSHAGLVDEGLQCLETMNLVYDVHLTEEKYTSVIDLLGRAGRLHEAEDVVKMTPFASNTKLWMPLLGSCRVHGNLEMGERIAERILKRDPGNESCYVLLSNIYAAAGKWDHRAAIQYKRAERGLTKPAGCTWIEVNGEVHSFRADDREHPQLHEICSKLGTLTTELKEAGYVPDPRFVLQNVDEEEQLSHLSHHSEKLAIAFGLISTPPGTTLRIFKNLRVCGDCHTAAKLIGKINERKILLRDATRFHQFENGHCSCGDYW